MEVIRRAYQVWHEAMLPEYGHNLDNLPITFAPTASRAKSLAQHLDVWPKADGTYAKYTDLRARRSKSDDVVLFEGQKMARYAAELTLEIRDKDKRFDEILENNPGAKVHIKKDGYFYGPNMRGYTEKRIFAGVYDIDAAIAHVKGRQECMDVVVLDRDEHNKLLMDTINDISSRLI